MATAIKSSPELWGEAAMEFDRLADENAKRPTPRLSDEEEQKLRDFLKRSKEFVFPWQRKS